jgi:hypothetical protein
MTKLSPQEKQSRFEQECSERRKKSDALLLEATELIINSRVKVAEATMLIEPYTVLLRDKRGTTNK